MSGRRIGPWRRSRFSASQARAWSRYSFVSGSSSMVVVALLVIVGSLDPVADADLLPVPVRLAVEEVVHGDPAKEEVGIVLPGVADAPEHLKAALGEVDPGVADPN